MITITFRHPEEVIQLMNGSINELVDSIGNQIEELRKEKQLTQKELSMKAGYDPTYAGKIERGDKTPSMTVLVHFAEALEVPFMKLFDDIPSSFQIN